MSLRVRVENAYPFDIGQSICRIPPSIAEQLSITENEVVKIIGGRITYAIAKIDYFSEGNNKEAAQPQLFPQVRLDLTTRRNSKTPANNVITIEKTHSIGVASVVSLASVEKPIEMPYLQAFLRTNLVKRIVCKGDVIDFEILGQKVPLIVAYTAPSEIDAVIITSETEVRLRDSPLTEIDIEQIPKSSFDDIGGMHDAKRLIREHVQLPLLFPEAFQQLGVAPPRGVLLYGSPGTGKTALGRAMASEIDAHFIFIAGPEVVGKHLAQAPQKLQEIFNEASQKAPTVIFIDEIDALAPRRKDLVYDTIMKNAVTELLYLMDGLKSTDRVIVIGATNDLQAIDPALRRNGRFDLEIELGIPNKAERLEILQIITRKMSLEENIRLDVLSESTYGFSGADLVSLCREAAFNALRRFKLPQLSPDGRRIPLENLQNLKIGHNDFIEALKIANPSILREVNIEVPRQRWEDIGGLDDVKQILKETVEWPMKFGEFYMHMGAESPHGVLFFGGPGTGKTTLARAVASECEANFISIKGPELLNKWLGKSEEAVREIFAKARQSAPCVIFFDEIDAIAPVRGRSETNVHAERVVSQILAEIDGLTKLKGVFVIGATNRPELVDPALLRPGRLGILIHIPIPDLIARETIFSIHCRDKPLDDDVSIPELAKKTEGYTGADIEEVCNRAAILAIRQNILEAGGESKFKQNIEKEHDYTEMRVGLVHFEASIAEIPPSGKSDDEEYYKDLVQKKFSQIPLKEAPRLYL